jgi:hypothetical protein
MFRWLPINGYIINRIAAETDFLLAESNERNVKCPAPDLLVPLSWLRCQANHSSKSRARPNCLFPALTAGRAALHEPVLDVVL